jgi:hypothetical protein
MTLTIAANYSVARGHGRTLNLGHNICSVGKYWKFHHSFKTSVDCAFDVSRCDFCTRSFFSRILMFEDFFLTLTWCE